MTKEPVFAFRWLAVFACSVAFLGACSGGGESSGPKASPVASVTISADTSIIRAAHTVALKAKALDVSGAEIPGIAFAWISSNAAVATTDQSGVVRAISPGYVSITASADGKFATYNLLVIRARIASISLTTPADISVGRRVRIQTTLIDSAGATDVGIPLTWTSSNESVARIADGELSPLAGGTTRIDASIEGITASVNITVPPLPSIRFKTISAHYRFTCGLSDAGAAFCWGSNRSGALGTGSPPLTTAKCEQEPYSIVCNLLPFPVDGGHTFSDLVKGLLHQCAMASDGAWCWGNGSAGEIGNGKTDIVNPVPAKVQSSATYTSLGGGRLMTCGLTTLHKVDCWGQNLYGELGDPTVTEVCPASHLIVAPVQCSRLPHTVSSALAFYKLAVGWSHACALTEDGTAYCWGQNSFGQIGADATAQCAGVPCNPTPTAVATDVRFTDISAGAAFTCGIALSGRAYCWGENDLAQSGIGRTSAIEPYPVPVNTNTTFVRVVTGDDSACALDAAGTAYCWGFNTSDQLGTGGPKQAYEVTPVRIPNIRFTTLSLGTDHSCGIATDGFAYCWGNNEDGQLGTGTAGNSPIPTRVAGQ